MSLLDTVRQALEEIVSAGNLGNAVYINTLCIYPSNGFVQVVVRGDGNSFTVSDNGGAVNEIISAGIKLDRPDVSLTRFVKDQGLNFKEAAIISPICSRAALPVAISLVANASKDMADWLFSISGSGSV